jgi:aryl-alcohol dehydrogenase-like predicted oxidoreductase
VSTSSRREFLVTSIGGLAASAALGNLARAQDAKSEAPTLPKLERRKLGKTDLTVGVLGFGGAEMGYAKTELDVVERMLLTALDQGLDAIDTAECYGISEEQIGATIAHRRDEFKLFTKVGHWPDDGWSAAGIGRSIERSLERLKTDHVDIVHLHSCGLDVLKKGEVIDALESARKAGKTRYIGYSGDSEAANYAVETGRFDTLMTSISIADQEAIDLYLPKAREREMGVIVKRGIANAAWRYDSEPKQGYHVEYWRRLQALDYDFCRGERRADEGPEGAAGIALRFTLGLPGVHTSVVGTTNPERFAANRALLAAGPLPQAQVDAIRKRWKEVAKPDWIGQT